MHLWLRNLELLLALSQASVKHKNFPIKEHFKKLVELMVTSFKMRAIYL
jgi:hypothetical protein